MAIKKKFQVLSGILLCVMPLFPLLAKSLLKTQPPLLADSIAQQLGWKNNANECGGNFIEPPFPSPDTLSNKNVIAITGNQGLYAQRGMSILEKKVTITRLGQQLTGNKAIFYRDPITNKLIVVDMMGNVHLREPNTLIIAKKGRYYFQRQAKILQTIFYRTTLMNNKELAGPRKIPYTATQKPRKITTLTAWGVAKKVSSQLMHRYELFQASYSTCPPTNPAWQVKASHISLNKNTGRGSAINARLMVKNIPVLYIPYIDFPIDKRRKTGFLWPTVGTSKRWGAYTLIPFYWYIAPNYDATISTGILTQRGLQLTNDFRYLTTKSSGNINFTFLPNDRMFDDLRDEAKNNPGKLTPAQQPTTVTQAELNRLIHSDSTRKAFSWRDNTRFNEQWSSHIDFNYASDDYYLHDFGNSVNDLTQNQLLQEAGIDYKGPHWNFSGRLQGYQTLHPVEDPPVANQYRRLPQLVLNGEYPNLSLGLTYFLTSEATHFEILRNPGLSTDLPTGNRFHLQPGISLPKYWPGFYINPRLQFAFTKYYLQQVQSTHIPADQQRFVPIFDIASGMNFTRDLTLLKHLFQQTLEPQLYYTYIPYRNQNNIPIFDTTVNTLTYDQIFNYNRFSGIDRIGDANQIGVGISTRLIDQSTGVEKAKLGVGQIVYFSKRRVTLCNDTTCTDNPTNPSNHWRVSPLSAIFELNIDPRWSLSANSIWSTTTKQLANGTINLHYKTDNQHIINLGYGFVHGGDVFSGISTNNAQNNIKTTDFSYVWPVIKNISMVGRWTQDWTMHHFQNLLFGLQYDTCCWSAQFVGGSAFINMVNNKPTYNTQFYVQFALKGLGNIGSGNASGLLSSISGYNPQFGQEL